MDWFIEAMKKYAVFSGRARRKEYWYFALIYMLIWIVLGVFDGIIGRHDEQSGFGLLSGLFWVATLLPATAVGVRRLHDIGRSGWWMLIALVPVIGWIVLVVFAARRGDAGSNRFGPDPMEAA